MSLMARQAARSAAALLIDLEINGESWNLVKDTWYDTTFFLR